MIDLQNVKVKDSSDWDNICPFPVGFIYMSRNKNSPADLYGGQWTPMPSGRFVQIVNTSTGIITNGGANAHIHLTSIGKVEGEANMYVLDGDVNLAGEWTDPTGSPYNAIFVGGSRVFTNGTSGNGFNVNQIPGSFIVQNGAARLNSTAQANHIPPYTTAYAWYRTA